MEIDFSNNRPKLLLCWKGVAERYCDYCDISNANLVWLRQPYNGTVPEGFHVTDCPFCKGLYQQAYLGHDDSTNYYGICECARDNYPGKVLMPDVLPHAGCWKCHGSGYHLVNVDIKIELIMDKDNNLIEVWTPDCRYHATVNIFDYSAIYQGSILKEIDMNTRIDNARQKALEEILKTILASVREGTHIKGITISKHRP